MSDRPHAADPGTLEEVLRQIWALLGHGAGDPSCAAHLPALATIGSDGTPAVRTVVLRAFDAKKRALTMCTDRRSRKSTEIERAGVGAMHIYDPASLVQIRLRCRLALHTDDELAMNQWDKTDADGRPLYQIAQMPGSPIDHPDQVTLAPESTRQGRAHFAVISAQIEAIDWLLLREQGHRRAQFAWRDGALDATWVVP